MTKIDFDEASVGEVTADNQAALKCMNKGGKAAGVWARLATRQGIAMGQEYLEYQRLNIICK